MGYLSSESQINSQAWKILNFQLPLSWLPQIVASIQIIAIVNRPKDLLISNSQIADTMTRFKGLFSLKNFFKSHFLLKNSIFLTGNGTLQKVVSCNPVKLYLVFNQM